MYKHLNIPNFEQAKPEIEDYINSVNQYEKNNSNNLDAKIIQDINKRWKFAFETWNYNMI
jgi:chorismate mutase